MKFTRLLWRCSTVEKSLVNNSNKCSLTCVLSTRGNAQVTHTRSYPQKDKADSPESGEAQDYQWGLQFLGSKQCSHRCTGLHSIAISFPEIINSLHMYQPCSKVYLRLFNARWQDAIIAFCHLWGAPQAMSRVVYTTDELRYVCAAFEVMVWDSRFPRRV